MSSKDGPDPKNLEDKTVNRAEYFNAMFSRHELEVVTEGGPVQCWRLARPNTDTNAMLITATPEGVVIQYVKEKAGKTSTMDLATFVSETDACWLADQFLTKQWSPEAARGHLKGMLLTLMMVEAETETYHIIASDLAASLRHKREHEPQLFDSAAEWQKNLSEELDAMIGVDQYGDQLIDESEAFPPLTFDAEDVAQLCAVHDRFRDLFMARYRIVAGQPVLR